MPTVYSTGLRYVSFLETLSIPRFAGWRYSFIQWLRLYQIDCLRMHELTRFGRVAIGVTVSLGTLAVIAVGLRIYCRLKLMKLKLGLDAWLMLAALVTHNSHLRSTVY